jgi:hypothetical protein
MVFKKGTKGRPLLLLLPGQMCTEDVVDCVCASVAHQVSIEHLCSGTTCTRDGDALWLWGPKRGAGVW